MKNIPTPWICTHCGYFSRVRFPDDICPACKRTDWQCSNCGYTLTAKKGLQVCTQCGAVSSFTNISCYIPDWPILGEVEPILEA
jgi:rubrerythrin